MLMPRRLGGSFGATDGMFRVLLCRQGKVFCGTHWTANDSHQLARDLNERGRHESLCVSGILNGVPVA